MNNLISMRDLSKAEILQILEVAEKIESGKLKVNIPDKVAALLFSNPLRVLYFPLILQ